MSIEEHAAAAAELKATGKCNCTQSVVKVFEDKLPIDDETLQVFSRMAKARPVFPKSLYRISSANAVLPSART